MHETLPKEKTIDMLLEERMGLQKNLNKLKSKLDDIEINQSNPENKNSIVRQVNFLEIQINSIDEQINNIQGIKNKEVI